ncbi:MAG TPA: adenylate kinase [Thermoanaerobaculia bacterium]|nr:adenylate kinase [Thermoanaerobaculia bacterium]
MADAAEASATPAAAEAAAGFLAPSPARPMRVVLLGPPNAGKGTQAAMLSAKLGVPSISTGEMLRREAESGTPLGLRVKAIMDSGGLVDDDTMAAVVRERLRQADAAGFVLDGYPRTLAQAETLAGILAAADAPLHAVLLISVPEEQLVRRALARGRFDDREDVIRERLRVYREKTEPLIGYYSGLGLLREIDGDRPVEEVGCQLLAALEAQHSRLL